MNLMNSQRAYTWNNLRQQRDFGRKVALKLLGLPDVYGHHGAKGVGMLPMHVGPPPARLGTPPVPASYSPSSASPGIALGRARAIDMLRQGEARTPVRRANGAGSDANANQLDDGEDDDDDDDDAMAGNAEPTTPPPHPPLRDRDSIPATAANTMAVAAADGWGGGRGPVPDVPCLLPLEAPVLGALLHDFLVSYGEEMQCGRHGYSARDFGFRFDVDPNGDDKPTGGAGGAGGSRRERERSGSEGPAAPEAAAELDEEKAALAVLAAAAPAAASPLPASAPPPKHPHAGDPLLVEDPVNVMNNVTKSCYKAVAVQRAFLDALDRVKSIAVRRKQPTLPTVPAAAAPLQMMSDPVEAEATAASAVAVAVVVPEAVKAVAERPLDADTATAAAAPEAAVEAASTSLASASASTSAAVAAAAAAAATRTPGGPRPLSAKPRPSERSRWDVEKAEAAEATAAAPAPQPISSAYDSLIVEIFGLRW